MTIGEQLEGREKGTEGWQQICYVEAHCLFSQPDINRMMNLGSCKGWLRRICIEGNRNE